ncbi:MAG TPA: hypothetical protein VK141_06005 [Nitrosomonas sp.]|nr:hypothetical protein [Nitrosomonas sp.]
MHAETEFLGPPTKLFELLINSANEMKHHAHGTLQPRPVDPIGWGENARNEAIRSCSDIIGIC